MILTILLYVTCTTAIYSNYIYSDILLLIVTCAIAINSNISLHHSSGTILSIVFILILPTATLIGRYYRLVLPNNWFQVLVLFDLSVYHM